MHDGVAVRVHVTANVAVIVGVYTALTADVIVGPDVELNVGVHVGVMIIVVFVPYTGHWAWVLFCASCAGTTYGQTCCTGA